jgi:hypothetical protein
MLCEVEMLMLMSMVVVWAKNLTKLKEHLSVLLDGTWD